MNQWDVLKFQCPNLYKNDIEFECDVGWYDLLQDLSIKIENIIKKNIHDHKVFEGEENEPIEMYTVQVKEKYGTLRFYMSCETEEISKLINEAEYLSSKTCERCGSHGKIRGITWFSTRCDKCYEETK
jgi:hypothetical protein